MIGGNVVNNVVTIEDFKDGEEGDGENIFVVIIRGSENGPINIRADYYKTPSTTQMLAYPADDEISFVEFFVENEDGDEVIASFNKDAVAGVYLLSQSE